MPDHFDVVYVVNRVAKGVGDKSIEITLYQVACRSFALAVADRFGVSTVCSLTHTT